MMETRKRPMKWTKNELFQRAKAEGITMSELGRRGNAVKQARSRQRRDKKNWQQLEFAAAM
jgi:hypothetical protein